MKRRKEHKELVLDIKNAIPGFNEDEVLQYTKWAIPKLYNSLKNDEKIEIRCNPELLNKLDKEKAKYRINKNMDHISVQFAELFDNFKKDDEMYLQIYLSIYFYDNVKNNDGNNSINDNYWNDIWIITYRESTKSDKINSKCANCGAVMKYNQLRNIFECEYCGNIILNDDKLNWEIVDIELEN